MLQQRDAIERNKKPAGALEIPDDFKFYYLNKQDRQMRFNNGGDPIYAIFDKIDERRERAIFFAFAYYVLKKRNTDVFDSEQPEAYRAFAVMGDDTVFFSTFVDVRRKNVDLVFLRLSNVDRCF